MPLTISKGDLVLYLIAHGWEPARISEAYPESFGKWTPHWMQWEELSRRGFTTEEYAEHVGKPTDEAILDLVTMEADGIIAYKEPSHRGAGRRKKTPPSLWYVIPELPKDEDGNPPLMKSLPARGYKHCPQPTRRHLPSFKPRPKHFLKGVSKRYGIISI